MVLFGVTQGLLVLAGGTSTLNTLSMGVPLVALVLLIFLGAISARKKSVAAQKVKPQGVGAVETSLSGTAPPPVVQSGISPEVVAVIAAAVAAASEGKQVLRSVSTATKGRGAWGLAGLLQTTEPF